MKPTNKIAVLVSGGLDSSVLLTHLCKNHSDIYPIYVKNGNYWEKIELYWLRKFISLLPRQPIRPIRTLSVPVSDIFESNWFISGEKIPDAESADAEVYLPGRNILLIAKTAVFCAQNQIHDIALAHLKTNPFPDAKPSFFKTYSKLLSQALNWRIHIKTPFITKTKKEVMQLGKELNLRLTFSCLNPKKYDHCGRCNKCTERKNAFKSIGLKDPTHYSD